MFFPFKEECIEVDVSTIKVAPHRSRGRVAEGLYSAEAGGRDVVELLFQEFGCACFDDGHEKANRVVRGSTQKVL